MSTAQSRTDVVDGKAGGGSTGPESWRRLVLVGMTVLVAVALVAVGWLGSRAVGESAGERSAAAAMEAARTGMTQVLSYDSATLDADLGRARQLVTGAFAEQVEQTARDVMSPASRNNTFSAVATITRSAVVSAESGRVDVLLMVDQTFRTSGQPDPESRRLQLVVTMTPGPDGRWLISEMQAL